MTNDERPHRRWTDTEDAIAVEVRQQMTPYVVTVQRLDRDVETLRTTVYGNPAIQQRGLVESVRSIESKLDQIIDQRQQTTWLMRGVAAGLAINFAQITGLLPALLKIFTP